MLEILYNLIIIYLNNLQYVYAIYVLQINIIKTVKFNKIIALN